VLSPPRRTNSQEYFLLDLEFTLGSPALSPNNETQQRNVKRKLPNSVGHKLQQKQCVQNGKDERRTAKRLKKTAPEVFAPSTHTSQAEASEKPSYLLIYRDFTDTNGINSPLSDEELEKLL